MIQRNTPQIVGLIGWPVKHSVSPDMFNAAFATLDMNWRYEIFPTEPERIAQVVEELLDRQIRGFNVTVPHKRAIMPLLDAVRPEARAIGAVNTVTRSSDDDQRLEGTNTDVYGFRTDLTGRISAHPQGSGAIILGSGGAARAAAYVLGHIGYQLHIVTRDPARGIKLIQDVQPGLATSDTQRSPVKSAQGQMQAFARDHLGKINGDIKLIVNCTPVGMWPNVHESPWPEEVPFPQADVVYDMVYRPERTRLMQQAEAAGIEAHGGLGMLIHQGAAAFRLWTGLEPSIDIMYSAAQRALKHDT